MNAKKAKRIRAAASYHPGEPAQYEKPAIHHLVTVPVYETHQRTIRTLDHKHQRPEANTKLLCGKYSFGFLDIRRRVISGSRATVTSHTVTKIKYKADGKTPLMPVLQYVKQEDGTMGYVPHTALLPISTPCRLAKGSARQVYKLLKKMERTIGLDNIYNQMMKEAA